MNPALFILLFIFFVAIILISSLIATGVIKRGQGSSSPSPSPVATSTPQSSISTNSHKKSIPENVSPSMLQSVIPSMSPSPSMSSSPSMSPSVSPSLTPPIQVRFSTMISGQSYGMILAGPNVANASTTPGLWYSCVDGSSQTDNGQCIWIIAPLSSTTFSIQNLWTSLYLAIQNNGNVCPGTPTFTITCSSTPQAWNILSNGNSTFTIQHVNTGSYLTYSSSSQPITTACSMSTSSDWTLTLVQYVPTGQTSPSPTYNSTPLTTLP